jgi:dUTP pyrophosphatase
MTEQKRRNTKSSHKSETETVDLGMIEMNAVQPGAVGKYVVTETVETIDSEKVSIGIYKLSETAKTPTYATQGSACFDLYVDFSGVRTVKVYTPSNLEVNRHVQQFREFWGSQGVVIDSGERALIPVNLIFDIPEGWKMLIYARSGNALKQAMLLANSVGVVDHDYVDPVFVIVFNQSNERLIVKQGDRIAQAEIVPAVQASFNILSDAPGQKTTRAGGFGSTGK